VNVVIDTNVIVSGLLKPFSPSGEIVRLVADGKIRICYDARILLEYEEVLLRPKFGFEPTLIAVLMDSIRELGVCTAGNPLKVRLPDPADEMFVEIANDSQCRLLITGNSKHFPQKSCSPVKVMTPREFLTFIIRTDYVE
jgi:putative PIN family toxin of toxin-antitoxin system